MSASDPIELLTVADTYRLDKDGQVGRRYKLGHLYLPENARTEVSRTSLAELRRPDWAWEISLPARLRAPAVTRIGLALPGADALGARLCAETMRYRQPNKVHGAFICRLDASIKIGRNLSLHFIDLQLSFTDEERGAKGAEFNLRTWERMWASSGVGAPIINHAGLSRPAIGETPSWRDWLNKLDKAYRPDITALFDHLATTFTTSA
jgi:hypothetical protein